ncbi:MAG: ThiF family adenylyltransferase [Methanofastidiosum sp.]
MTDAYMRSVDIFNPKKSRPVSIIGCGSIGSFAALTLAKMGVQSFHLFDADTVGEENIGCQNFGWEHLGKLKVEAVRDILVANSPVKPENVYLHPEFVTFDTKLPKIITIVGVDSMTARHIIWEKLKNKVPLIVDGRIGGQIVRVFNVLPTEEYTTYYEKYLVDEEQAEELPCTQRNVSYVANITQAIIGRAVRNFIESGKVEKEIGIDVATFINYVKG